MLHILRRPAALRSGSDILGTCTETYLNRAGIPTVIRDIWPDQWARALFISGVPFGRRLFENGPAAWSLKRHLEKIQKGDLVMISGSAKPLDAACEFEREIIRRGASYILHLQDDWLSIPYLKPQLEARLPLASLVVVPTEPLKQRLLEFSRDLPIEVWDEPVDVNRLAPPSRRPAVSIIAWTGTSYSMKYLELIGGILERLQHEVPFRLRLIFDRKPKVRLPLSMELFHYRPESEIEGLGGASAGLAPLDGSPYTCCKGCYKTKTYMAAGVPPVASAVGFHNSLIDSGTNGFLVKDKEEWESALRTLLTDPARAAEMGRKAREKAIRHFSHEVVMPQWIRALKSRFGPQLEPKK